MVDYSKWKDIEISDDEDDTHPNIDTPSLFRWRHQARVERVEELEHTKKAFEAEQENNKKKLNAIREKLQSCKDESDVSKLQQQLNELEVNASKLSQKADELRLQEKKTPWNVDTISKPGFAKTIINTKPAQRSYDELTDEEKEQKMRDFVKENEKILKQYGILRKFDDSKKFLLDHSHLVCEATANYLVIWCINLEMEKKTELMAHVAHQCICMQFILELAKQLDVDPRACVGSFFQRIQVAEIEYKSHFDSEVKAFKERITKRAAEKIEEALAEQEEEERKARLGPGGLDPLEVFETLPESLQQCFESRNIELLQETVSKMPEDEAKYHIKRCVDSGLWVPDAAQTEKMTKESPDTENVYEEAKGSATETDQKPSVSTDDID